jgi:hypothetical protein
MKYDPKITLNLISSSRFIISVFWQFYSTTFRENITDRIFKFRSDWNTIENFDQPPISTNCLYRLHKQSGIEKGHNKGKRK